MIALPEQVWSKLKLLDAHCASLAAQLERGRSRWQQLRRERRNLKLDDTERFDALGAALQAQQADIERLERRLTSAQRTGAECRQFLHELPDGAVLTMIEPRLGDLDSVRSAIKQVRSEIGRIEAMPIADPYLENRVWNYVTALAEKAAPRVRGIGDGERLQVLWALNDHASVVTQTGYASDQANPLLLAALLTPEAMVERIMKAATDGLLSPDQRAERLEQLNAELTQLRYDEESAVAVAIERNEDVTRASAPPWAILQVRIAEQPTEAA
jgi:hypothetical protein